MYSHVCLTDAREYAFVAGQVAVDKEGSVVGKNDFDTQIRQVFANLEQAVLAAGAGMENICKMTTYLVHSQDIENFYRVRADIFREYFPSGEYPPNTLLIIDRLVREEFLIEVEAIDAVG